METSEKAVPYQEEVNSETLEQTSTEDSPRITSEDKLRVLNVIFEIGIGVFVFLLGKQLVNYLSINWEELDSLSALAYLGGAGDDWELVISGIKAPFRNSFIAYGIGLLIFIIGLLLSFPKRKK